MQADLFLKILRVGQCLATLITPANAIIPDIFALVVHRTTLVDLLGLVDGSAVLSC
jgi:hypothetical protein